jgi:hypothetical protein
VLPQNPRNIIADAVYPLNMTGGKINIPKPDPAIMISTIICHNIS